MSSKGKRIVVILFIAVICVISFLGYSIKSLNKRLDKIEGHRNQESYDSISEVYNSLEALESRLIETEEYHDELLSRLERIESRLIETSYQDEQDITTTSDIEVDVKLTQELINSIDVTKMDLLEIRGQLNSIKDSIYRIDNLLYSQEEISLVYGTIVNIDIGEQIYIEIAKNKSDLLDTIKVEISENCKPYFVGQYSMVKGSLEDFIEKTETEISSNFYDDYTFVLVDEKIVHVYQGIHKY